MATKERSVASDVARKENTVANPFVPVELNTPDPKKAKAFYSKLFQWQPEDVPNPAVPDGRYTIIKVGEGTGGGLMRRFRADPRDGSLTLRSMTFAPQQRKRTL